MRYFAIAILSLVVGSPVWACYTPIISGVNRTNIEYVRVVVENSAAGMVAGGATSIYNGFHKWNQAPCQDDQPASWVRPFPTFSTSLGSMTVTVKRNDNLSSDLPGTGDTCAATNPASSNPTIFLFSRIRDDQGNIFSCNWDSPERTALIIAHELGHYLGLGESNCSGSIMGGWGVSWNQNNMVATYLAAGHAIRDYECEKADEISLSPTEMDYTEQQCSSDPSCDPYAPCHFDPGCTCPIVLDLDRNQFHFSRVDDPVEFDIDADGQAEWITWTRAGEEDAFLCWDRNGNGRIDNGSELFGNSTPLASGTIAPFGYLALSELDGALFGGDGDGLLTRRDSAFELLCLWTDWNHDGSTDPGELVSLSSSPVTAVGVNWVTEPRTDEAGNLLLYHGEATLDSRGKERRIRTTDVFFVELEP